MVSYKALNTTSKYTITYASHTIRDDDVRQRTTIRVSIISWLSVLYVLNDRKVAIWILYGNEMAKI